MSFRKEERPDPKTDTPTNKAGEKIGLDNPEYNYRVLYDEPELRTYNRVGKHKRMGYEVVAEGDGRVVMACKKDRHEQRQAESRARSEQIMRRKTAISEGDGYAIHMDTTDVVRGDD